METVEQQLQPPAQRDREIAGVAALLLLIGMPVWLLPRERAAGRAARSALILAIVSLVLIVVFWTGFPFGFAAGAVALGLSARAAAPQADGEGKATVAIVLGALVMLVAFVGLLIG